MITLRRQLHRVCSRASAPINSLSALVDARSDLTQLLNLLSYAKPRYVNHGAFAAEILAPFVSPAPSRFSDGSYGVLYSAETLDTAIVERRFHTARWLAASHAPATLLPVLALKLRYAGQTHDATRVGRVLAASIYDADPAHYAGAQEYGSLVRARGAAAVRYRSVRDEGGRCFGVFRHSAVRSADLDGEYRYEWDGHAVVNVLHLRDRGHNETLET